MPGENQFVTGAGCVKRTCVCKYKRQPAKEEETMATALFSFKKLSNGRVMFHGFLAPSQATAEADMKAHAEGCPDFGPAFRADQTIEIVQEVESLPDFDGDDLEEWLAEYFGETEDDDVIDMVPE